MIRRQSAPPRAGVRYTLRPGAYAILTLGDRVLLTHQAAPVPEWQLPGGGIDPGEHPLPALHREVMEETGWTIAAPRRIGAFRRFVWMPEYGIHAEKLCAVYLARPVRRTGPPSEPGHSASLIPLRDGLRMLGNPGDRAMLERWLRLGR